MDAPSRSAVALTTKSPRTSSPRTFREGWLHLCNGLDPVRDGGMVPSILGMTGGLAERNDTPVTIVTPTHSALGDTQIPPQVSLRGPETDLESMVRTAEVVHIHGLWQVQTRRGARAARSSSIPYLITAHGHAEPWALRHKALKKKIYTALIEGKNLRRAACLHALSRPEIGYLRALAPTTPVCYIPNGVNLAPFDSLPDRSVLEAEFPELAGKFLLLFFGRIHVKKGLDMLAEAFSTIKNDYPDVHILLAGKDDGALGPFLDRAAADNFSSRVTWVGHVSGERARQVWGAADAFILPSYSEGFSMAILEALGSRLPSLITTTCYFDELGEAEGGIVVTPDVDAVRQGLRDLLDRSPEERAEMGQIGRALVEQKYTWDQQVSRLAEVYRWVSGGGSMPEAVAAAEPHT
ncbi:glycosyltransferase [Singulisphaera sp. PoT]|uniref:glycosyltransferase n=1 Tax=Singulisphaera sp. PoT TaxID=3411797 RepID=UPI003BF51725